VGAVESKQQLVLSTINLQFVDTCGAGAGVLRGAGDEEAEVADAGGLEAALYIVSLVTVEQVEGFPLFGEAVAALQQAAAGDVGACLASCVDEAPRGDGLGRTEVEGGVVGRSADVAPLGAEVAVDEVVGLFALVGLAGGGEDGGSGEEAGLADLLYANLIRVVALLPVRKRAPAGVA